MGVELVHGREGYLEMEDVNFSDSDLAYHVKDALKSVSLGDSDSYNQLIGVLHQNGRLSPDDLALLVTSLKAISGAISYVDIVHHESLLTSIFNMSMWDYRPEVMDALVEVIISLAASNGKYVDSCLDMLVSNFLPPRSFSRLLSEPIGIRRKDQVLCRVHSALKDIADLVPLAPLRLWRIIIQRMPNTFSMEPLISIYVENMLRLESSPLGELLGSMMLMAVMDRLVELDVEIEWDDILQEDSNKGIFDMELENVEDFTDDDDNNDDELPKDTLNRKRLGGNLVAEKLDSLMVITFEHLKSCANGGRLVEVFEILRQSFRVTVLNAYKSKFAQFVMFYTCSLDPEYCGVKFSEFLLDMFVDGIYPLTRMSAVAYLASYLSRGKFLSASLVLNILKSLVDWCVEYCQNQDGDISPKAHRIFYAGCQAVMYVLCFRMRSIMEIPRLKAQLLLMPLESLLRHPLTPLKVCLPSIVDEFLRQAKAAHLFTVSETFIFDDLLESEYSRAFGGMERLDMFFPFDPCLLKKCDSYIRPNFVYWSMVRATYDNEEECSSDEGFDEVSMDGNVDNNEDLLSNCSEGNDLDLDEFDNSLNKMSITPKDPLRFSFGGQFEAPTRMPSILRPSTSPESL